jgi:hypothetical protein
MSGILLGALAYSGLNKNKIKSTNNEKTKSTNDINYSTNIKDMMNKIESNQTQQNYRKPEYLNQFDDLRFDNIGDPAGINDSYNTLIGQNASLKRDIQVKENFSFFDQNRDGTYNIVSQDNFVHNNMYPNTTQRDINKSLNYSQRKMETFTGSSNNIILKQPSKHLFEPMADLTYIYGAPVNSDLLKQRYLASNKNNMGDLPFSSKAKVLPGIEGSVQSGTYNVYRINPPTVDQLRSNGNKKITYLNKPLESMKKGEIRGNDFNVTKYKLPDFREQKFSDLVATKAIVDRQRQDGVFTNIESQRGENEIFHHGHSVNSTMGYAPDVSTICFETSKKESYENNNSHSVADNLFKPVLTNSKSYTICDNQRTSINTNYQGGIQLSTQTYNGVLDKAKDTIKQTTSHNIITNITPSSYETYTNISGCAKPTIKQHTSHNIVSNITPSSYETYTNISDCAKPTLKQHTSHNIVSNITPSIYETYTNISDCAKPTIKQHTSHNIVSNLTPPIYETYTNISDIAKPTIKQNTSHNIVANITPSTNDTYSTITDKLKPTIKQCTSHNIVSNIMPNVHEGYTNITDIAKNTIKQTTENTQYIGTLNDGNNSTYLEYNDNAKATIKETTSALPQPISNIYSSSGNTYSKTKNDIAKETIKQTTVNNNYISNLKSNINSQISHESANNMTQNICREAVVTFNRPANGKSDLNGPYINKDTVKFNDSVLYSYTGNPYKALDHSVAPTLSNQQIIDINNIKSQSKPINQSVSYYINSNYINTLNNNPYVNDIFHQKNY